MLESRLYRSAEVVANLLILNVLWLLASLPVVTLFPATAALFGVVRAWQRTGEPPIAAAFIQQFRQHFAQSALLSGPWIVFGAAITAVYIVIGQPDSPGWWLLFMANCTALVMFLFASVFFFPVLVTYNVHGIAVMRFALLQSIKETPTTLLCVLVVTSIAVLTAAVPILALWSGSVTAYAVYWLCRRTFPQPAICNE